MLLPGSMSTERNLLAWMRKVVSNPIPPRFNPGSRHQAGRGEGRTSAPERKNGPEHIAQSAGSVD